jgi:GT2 family glycosyltransferase
MELISWDSGRMIDLVVVSSGRTKELISMTQGCIDSFHRTCLGRVIVVGEHPIKYLGAMTIPQYKPFNYNQSLNDGFRLTTMDWICFANNDVTFLPDWSNCIDSGYKSISCLNPGWRFHEGMKGVVEGYRIGYELCGWCLILHRGVMERIGGFPTDVDFWHSDDLYADVLRKYGIKHCLDARCSVRHNASTTLLKSKDKIELTMGQEDKYKKAKEKWCSL